MKLYKKSFYAFIKNKWMLCVLLGYLAITMIQISRQAEFGVEISIFTYTQQLLMRCPQFFILFLILSYEYFSEPYRLDIDESLQTTPKGNNNQISKAQIAVMITLLAATYLLLSAFALILTFKSFAARGITSPSYMVTWHILKCLFINIFLTDLIGILLGRLFAKIRKRIIGYAAIMAVVLIVSYLMNEIATMILVLTDYSVNLFSILDIFNIMPPGLKFRPIDAFGFPIMGYRICLILFWCLLILTILTLHDSKQKRILKVTVCGAACILMLFGYAPSASRVDMSLNSDGSAMADQHYYEINNYRVKEEKSNFSATRYDMILDIGRSMSAKVKITVSDCQETYKFTLSHSYAVSTVTDMRGNTLPFQREGDTLLIQNPSQTTTFTIEYTGSNEAYYTNSQGMNLHGSFPYYPIPGYHQITEDGLYMNQLFLDQTAYFDITVHTRKTVYSNLSQDSKNHFSGNSQGVTLVSGLYEEKELNNVRIIYPPTIGWTSENLNLVTKAARDAGYSWRTVFITPNMNRFDDALNKEQIITRNYFEDVSELRDGYPNDIKGE